MLILAAILISLLISFAILGLRFTRLRTGYLWVLAVMSSFVAWVLVFAARWQLPVIIPLANWQSEHLLESLPTLLIDHISWPFALAVITLPLVVILTSITRENERDPNIWSFSMALGGLGLIAVVSGNPFTLLIAWAIIDILEIVILLINLEESQSRERAVIAFSVRVAGMFFLISAMLRANGMGAELTFENIPVEVVGYIFLAAGLRLGVFPLHQPFLEETPLRRGLDTIMRLVPVCASLVLLVRAAQVDITGIWKSIFLILTTIFVISSAFIWLRAKDELQGRPYWILGLAAFAFVAAIQGLQGASLAWSLALIFSGAILFIFSAHHRWLMIFPVLGAVGFSALPLTPAWEGSSLFFALPLGSRIIFFLALALFFVGYLHHSRRSISIEGGFERWMWIVYPLGLALLPVTHFGTIYLRWGMGLREISFQSPGWWSGLIPLGLAAILLVISRREFQWFPSILDRIGRRINFSWVSRLFWGFYRGLERILYVITQLLEGDGGILWALLILIMLIVTIDIWGSGVGSEL